MADPAPAETLAQLTRLSQKPGVQSTLLLSRQSGAIVRTSGLISKSATANPSSTLPASVDDTEYTNGSVSGSGMQSAEEVARAVFKFVEAAGGLVGGLEGGEAEGNDGVDGRKGGEEEGEVKLLRVRTRRHEFVIVPSAKFILVAVHDTPPA